MSQTLFGIFYDLKTILIVVFLNRTLKDKEMKRRQILKSLALTGVAPLLSFKSVPGGISTSDANLFNEPAKQIVLAEDTDVVVCGGGPAGVAAAIAAARSGAKTRLIEVHGCLGGIWTVGLLSNLIDHEDKSGIMREIVERLKASDAQITAKNYDSEAMKVLLDTMCQEAGVDIRLHTRVVAAFTNSKNKLETIITESQSGREAWKAKTFVDATGNGDLAAQAGCSFDMGHPDSGKIQPASMMAILTGLKRDEIINNNLTRHAGVKNSMHKLNLKKEIQEAGMDPSYGLPTLFPIRDDLFALMANHQYDVNSLDAQDITNATLQSRLEVNNIVDRLRKKGGIWSKMRIVATSEQIGLREGRRIRGLYTVTKEDLIKGAKFKDAACRVNFPVDIHSIDGKVSKGLGNDGIKALPYDIPVRSLISKDVGGLLMAGRCISGDFFAHASYRVTGNAVAMGETAGNIAAIASKKGCLPQEVKWGRAK